MSNRLFVGGVHPDVNQDSLRAAFDAHGKVSEIRVPVDRETGRGRGFAFVSFESARDADQVRISDDYVCTTARIASSFNPSGPSASVLRRSNR